MPKVSGESNNVATYLVLQVNVDIYVHKCCLFLNNFSMFCLVVKMAVLSSGNSRQVRMYIMYMYVRFVLDMTCIILWCKVLATCVLGVRCGALIVKLHA